MATPVADSIPLVTADASTLFDEFINGLVQGGSWRTGASTGSPVAHTLTYSLNINDDGSIVSPSPGPGGNWTDTANLPMATAVANALAAYSNVANLSFQPITSGTYYFQSAADLAFTLTGSDLRNDLGAIGLAFFPDPDYVNSMLFADEELTRAVYPGPEGDVFLDNDYAAYDYVSPGGIGLTVILHELGHALGLKHPGDDGGNGRPAFGGFGGLGIPGYDSMKYTVMSGGIALLGNAGWGFAATPMPLDILAIQHIYGANTTYHADNDTYVLANDGVLKTIWDAGGIDTFDASALSFAVSIDLNPGAYSWHWTQTGPLGQLSTAIAYNVVIENAVGGAGNDTIAGNAVANVLNGGGGNDAIDGGVGIDTLVGGDGDDTYVANGTAAADGSRVAFVSDVVIEDVSGGTDTVRSSSNIALPDHVENLVLTGAPMWRAYEGHGNDLDNLITTEGSARQRLYGEAGDDTLAGGAGADQLDGGAGDDVLVWDAADTGITGGTGIDVLKIAGAGVTLDLTTISDSLIQDVEAVDLTGTGSNVLTLALSDVLAISSTTDTLRIEGDAGDVVNGSGWTSGDVSGGYHIWTQGAATLLVDTDITAMLA